MNITDTKARLVPFPLLQYYLGWRSLSPLRRACLREELQRHDWSSRPGRLTGTYRILNNHVHHVRPAALRRQESRGRRAAVHRATTSQTGDLCTKGWTVQALAPHSLDDLTYCFRLRDVPSTLRRVSARRHPNYRRVRHVSLLWPFMLSGP